MSAQVPNHSQEDRIRRDLQDLARGVKPEPWQGNSYWATVEISEGVTLYRLNHWSTTIAVFASPRYGVLSPLYFDARHISSTTRGFQGRIARGSYVDSLAGELALPTHQRRILKWDLPA